MQYISLIYSIDTNKIPTYRYLNSRKLNNYFHIIYGFYALCAQ